MSEDDKVRGFTENWEIGFVVLVGEKCGEIRLGSVKKSFGRLGAADACSKCHSGAIYGQFFAHAQQYALCEKHAHSRKKMRALEKKKEKNQCISNALAFHDFLWEGGRTNINPFIAGGKEIDAFDDFFPRTPPPPSKAYPAPFLHIYTILATQLPFPAGKEGRRNLFFRAMRRACFA